MPKCLKLLTILLVLWIGLNQAMAEEMLTWEDCIQEAKENHPDLIAEQEKVNQAKASRAVAISGLLPQISGSVTGKTSKASTGVTSDTYAYSLSGKQLLFDGLKTPHSVASSAKSIESAQYDYQVVSSNIRLKLRTAFVKLLKAQELLQITEDIAQRRRQNVELVELRYEAGREHKGSLLTSQADLAQAEFEVAQGQRAISLAQRQLTKELGRSKLLPIRVKGNFVIERFYSEKPDFAILAESSPSVQELIATKEASRFDLKSAQADFFPEVYADTSIGRTDSHWPPRQETWSAGVSLSLPIFEGGSRLAEVSKSRAKFNQAQADERSGRDSVILALEEQWKGLEDAIDKVQVEQKFLEAAQERAKIAQAQYSTGLISFDDWTIIEDNLVSTKKSFLDTQADVLIAQANWIQAKGGTLDYDQE